MNFSLQSQCPVSNGSGPTLKASLGLSVAEEEEMDAPAKNLSLFVEGSPVHAKRYSPYFDAQLGETSIIGQSTSTLSSSSSSSTSSTLLGVIGSGRRTRTVWTSTEDEILCALVQNSTASKLSWIIIATTLNESVGSRRTHKQCRERWLNHLRPGLKKGEWTIQEEHMIRYYHNVFGGKWSEMARVFVDRSEADLKNKWNSMQRSEKRKRAMKKNSVLAAAWVAHDAMNEEAAHPRDFRLMCPPSNEHFTFGAFAGSSTEHKSVLGTKANPDI